MTLTLIMVIIQDIYCENIKYNIWTVQVYKTIMKQNVFSRVIPSIFTKNHTYIYIVTLGEQDKQPPRI